MTTFRRLGRSTRLTPLVIAVLIGLLALGVWQGVAAQQEADSSAYSVSATMLSVPPSGTGLEVFWSDGSECDSSYAIHQRLEWHWTWIDSTGETQTEQQVTYFQIAGRLDPSLTSHFSWSVVVPDTSVDTVSIRVICEAETEGGQYRVLGESEAQAVTVGDANPTGSISLQLAAVNFGSEEEPVYIENFYRISVSWVDPQACAHEDGYHAYRHRKTSNSSGIAVLSALRRTPTATSGSSDIEATAANGDQIMIVVWCGPWNDPQYGDEELWDGRYVGRATIDRFEITATDPGQ